MGKNELKLIVVVFLETCRYRLEELVISKLSGQDCSWRGHVPVQISIWRHECYLERRDSTGRLCRLLEDAMCGTDARIGATEYDNVLHLGSC